MKSGKFHFLAIVCLAGCAVAQTSYDFGDPDGHEQIYIEQINRARANPGDVTKPNPESVRLATTTHPGILYAYSSYGVNLTMMKSELAAIPARPPLVPNARLMASARGHSQWMFAHAMQAHDQPGGQTFLQRITAVGYPYILVGENVFAYGMDAEDAQASFEVDWGPGGTGGMQAGRSHRANIHSSAYREIGIGAIKGSNSLNGNTVGPEIVSQDFGVQQGSQTFGTGVAYYDLDGDNSYDAGEGIAGLTVNVDGAGFSCTTARGGGWVVPVPAVAAIRAVTFSGLNVSQSINLDVPANANAKADLRMAYAAPAIISAPQATAGLPHTLAISTGSTGGVTGYRFTRWAKADAAVETCADTSNITAAIGGGYSLLNTAIKDGTTGASFHLANPNAANQSIELKPLYFGGNNPSLAFMSRLRTATSSEKFKVQIKAEGSDAWTDVYVQSGGGAAEAAFNARSASLAAVAGKTFRVRFLLQFSSGSYYGLTGDSYGWFIDTINFADVAQLGIPAGQDFSGSSVAFTPPAVGEELLMVQPIISARAFPGGVQVLSVVATPPLPATLTLGDLAQEFNGLARPVSVTSDPADLAVSVTYDGSPLAPTGVGSYTVRATVASRGYTGSAAGLLVVHPAAPDAVFDLTIPPQAQGRIEGVSPDGRYVNGSTAMLTAVPDPGYLFAGWSGAASGMTNPLELVMDSYKTLAGQFVPNRGDSDGDDITDYEEVLIGPIPSGLRVNDPFTLDLTGIEWGKGKAMTVSGLPAGLSYNPATKTIRGVIAAKPGTYQMVIRIWLGKNVTRSLAIPIVVDPFPSALRGNYHMLVETRESPGRPAGMVRISIAQAGLWTGSLHLSGQAARTARGRFVLTPGETAIHLTAVFPATRYAPAATVDCDLVGSSELVSGTCIAGSLVADVRGFRLAKGTRLPASTRIFTMALEPEAVGDGTILPGGIGWARGTIRANGVVSMLGTLGDAKKFTLSSAISAGGQAIIWAQPYRNSSSYLGGVVTLGDFGQTPGDPPAQTTPDNLRWFRAPDVREMGYPGGFPEQALVAKTSRWVVPATADAFAASLGLNGERTMSVEIIADATPNLPQSIRVGNTFRLTTVAPIPALAWAGSVNRTYGAFTGTLRFPTVIGTANGVFLQDDSFGSTIGRGLVIIPLVPGSGAKPFRTSAMLLRQN